MGTHIIDGNLTTRGAAYEGAALESGNGDEKVTWEAKHLLFLAELVAQYRRGCQAITVTQDLNPDHEENCYGRRGRRAESDS